MEGTNKKLEKHFKAIIGEDWEQYRDIINSWSIGKSVYSIKQGTKTIFTYWRGILSKTCEAQRVFEASGFHSTERNGIVEFLLSDVVCLPSYLRILSFSSPIVTLVSPVNKVAILTVESTPNIGASNNGDIKFIVKSYDSNGAALANVQFNWTCSASYSEGWIFPQPPQPDNPDGTDL